MFLKMDMKEKIQAFVSHGLVQKTLILQVGGVLSTAIQAGAGVVMARLLQPELFGRYSLAFSVASISSIFIGGAIIDAITPALSHAWARQDAAALEGVIGFYIRFFGVCALITVGIVLILPLVTSHLYQSRTIGLYASVIIIASLVSSAVFALTQVNLQVAGRIRTLAGMTFVDTFIRYGVMLALVGGGLGIWGAVSGHLVGALVMMFCAAMVYTRLAYSYGIMPRMSRIGMLARRASWQPLLRPTLLVLADSNIAMLYGALPVAMVGLYATGAHLAYFKLSFGYMLLAMSVMGPVSTVMNVHFPTVHSTNPSDLRNIFLRVTAVSVGLSSAITIVVALLAPFVFKVLYGVVYIPAVQYVYEFIPFGMLFGLGVGLGPLWRSLGKVRVSIYINLIMLGMGVPTGLWLMSRYGITGAVVMVTAWYTISHAISFGYLYRLLRHQVIA